MCLESALLLETSASSGGCEAIARRSRGTPRIANRLLRRVRDYASVRATGNIDEETADVALEVFEVDEAGLDKVDAALKMVYGERGVPSRWKLLRYETAHFETAHGRAAITDFMKTWL